MNYSKKSQELIERIKKINLNFNEDFFMETYLEISLNKRYVYLIKKLLESDNVNKMVIFSNKFIPLETEEDIFSNNSKNVRTFLKRKLKYYEKRNEFLQDNYRLNKKSLDKI